MRFEHKGFYIQPVESMPSSYEIKFQGQGKLATALHGYYTSRSVAVKTIDTYLNGGLKKAVVNEAGNKV